MKIIALSGVPGVGKSTIARMVAKEIGASVISISDSVKKHRVSSVMDISRNTRIVDIKDLQKVVTRQIAALQLNRKIAKSDDLVIIEGHMAHLLDFRKIASCCLVIILRCDPFVLKKRLKKRGWSAKKINDNILTEVLDIIPAE
ncbi:MAG: AAA family ATPase, partial [Candidatus Aenigmatarchaeota archaeon]